MTSELRKQRVTPIGRDLRDWRLGAPTSNRTFVTVGLGVIVSLLLVGLSFVAGAFVVHTVSAALFSGQTRSGSGQQSLKLQATLVEQRRAAVAAYAATLTQFKAVTARPPGAVGINLDAAETARRDAVLTGLTLECINAVDRYNLAALARSETQLRSAGLPERFVWSVDCAPRQ